MVIFKITYSFKIYLFFQLDLFVIETLCIICNFLYYIDKLADIKKQYYFYQWLSSNLPKLPTFLLEYKQLKNISELLITVMDYNAEEKCEICSCGILFATVITKFFSFLKENCEISHLFLLFTVHPWHIYKIFLIILI